MRLPQIRGFNVNTVSKYVAAAVYVAASIRYVARSGGRAHRVAGDALSLLLGPAWAIAVCGVLVNNVFYAEIESRDKTTRLGRLRGDLFGHILPAVVATQSAPDTIPVTSCTYSATVMIAVAALFPWLEKVYVGVPGWVIWGLAPAVAVAATHFRYWTPSL